MFRNLLLVLLPLALLPYGCTRDQVADMESYERGLILTWVALERGDYDRAARYGQDAYREWEWLRVEYGSGPVPQSVRQSAGRVDFWMDQLVQSATEADHVRATNALALIRNEVSALRPKFGVGQATDHLYDFHRYWNDFTQASNDPMMCLLTWKEYERLNDQAQAAWGEFRRLQPTVSQRLLPGLGDNAAEVEATSVDMNRALADLQRLLAEANHVKLAEPSRQIDRLFMDYVAKLVGYPANSDLQMR